LEKGLYLDRDRLFVATLCLTIVMTLVFGAALGYDLASNRGGSNQTVSTLAPDQGASSDNGTTATPTAAPAGAAAAAGANAAKPGSAAAPVVGSAQVGTNVSVASGAPILLGALITQSGPLDASDAYRAESAYVQWINSQNGINGHKFNLDVKDDSGDPSKGRPAFEQIVQEDHAFALVGECAPVTDAAIVNEINQDQIPIINDCLTSPAGYQSPYIWYIGMAPDTWQAIAARYLYKHQSTVKIRKPYVLCVNSSVTLPYCNGFTNEWKNLGGTTCSQSKCGGGYDLEQIGTTRAQYEAVATQIRQSGADSIVDLLEPTNELAFLQALQDQGMDPQKYPHYAPLGSDPNSIRTVGSFANGIYVCSQSGYFPSENVPAINQMRQVLKQYYPDTPPDNYALFIGWTPYVAFSQALRLMGSNISRQNLINTLNAMHGFNDGVEPPLGWTAGNHSGPLFTRWAQITGPDTYNIVTGFEDQNGSP
jgi:ABC-type branched-subunit amino acid transport system substrate-binding protein